MWNGLISHLPVVDKNSGGIPWEQGVPVPHQAPSPGFQCLEGKSIQLLTAKIQQGLSQWKKLLEPQAVPLKKSTQGLTYSLWASSAGEVA